MNEYGMPPTSLKISQIENISNCELELKLDLMWKGKVCWCCLFVFLFSFFIVLVFFFGFFLTSHVPDFRSTEIPMSPFGKLLEKYLG